MREIVERLFEYHRLDELGPRGETSLRKVLEQLADLLGIENSNSDYILHHKDGDHSLNNLVLMTRSDHSKYHAEVRRNGLTKEDPGAITIFKDHYQSNCIMIGDEILKLINSATTIESQGE